MSPLTVLLVYIVCILKVSSDPLVFVCTDGEEIPLGNICDGQVQCRDQSDESRQLCYHVICPIDMLRCHYGACVSREARCNGARDCFDGSDESQCGRKNGSCEPREYRCGGGACIAADKMCDGVADCEDQSDETKETCEEMPCSIASHHCRHGGCIHLDARCDGYADCTDGSDEEDTLCRALKCVGPECTRLQELVACPPIVSSRIHAVCESKEGIVPCDRPVPSNTLVKYKCMEHYRPASVDHLYNIQAVCQLDGSWSRVILKCEPVCGVRDSVIAPLVVHGWSTTPEYWPWHATIYVHKSGEWIFWCGGSVISEQAVITAAHCTWSLTATTMKVAVGKESKDFNVTGSHTQIIDVKNITMHPLYQDIEGNYGSDIAVLELTHAIRFSDKIRPVCLDWKMDDITSHIKQDAIGTVVGMGITENDTYSDTIRGVAIPVVSNEQCITNQTQDFRKYITYTAFCAGWANGTGVCNGDSGGGLVFPSVRNRGTWVLQGVVSVSPRKRSTSFCDPNFFTVFTKVGMYVQWIANVLDGIHPERIVRRRLPVVL